MPAQPRAGRHDLSVRQDLAVGGSEMDEDLRVSTIPASRMQDQAGAAGTAVRQGAGRPVAFAAPEAGDRGARRALSATAQPPPFRAATRTASFRLSPGLANVRLAGTWPPLAGNGAP